MHRTFGMIIVCATLLAGCNEAPVQERQDVAGEDDRASMLVGEWRVEKIDGSKLAEVDQIFLKAGPQVIDWASPCAQQMQRYYIDEQSFTAGRIRHFVEMGVDPTASIPPPCAIGLPPRLDEAMSAVDVAREIERVSQDRIRISGNGRSITLRKPPR